MDDGGKRLVVKQGNGTMFYRHYESYCGTFYKGNSGILGGSLRLIFQVFALFKRAINRDDWSTVS